MKEYHKILSTAWAYMAGILDGIRKRREKMAELSLLLNAKGVQNADLS